MAKITTKKTGGTTSIVIKGDACIDSASETHAAVKKAYEAAKSIEVHCFEVDRADVSFVQLMISLIKTAKNDNKPCVIASVSDVVHKLITDTGYERVCRENGIAQI